MRPAPRPPGSIELISPWPAVKQMRAFSPASTLRIAPVMACSSFGFTRVSSALLISTRSAVVRIQCFSPFATTATASATTRP